jgi:hypothetical protein
MSKKKRRSKPQAQPSEPVRTGRKTLLACLLAFLFGAVITVGVVMLISHGGRPYISLRSSTNISPTPDDAGRRSVADLTAMSDAELEQVDVVEMNISVAREIPVQPAVRRPECPSGL